MEKLTVTQCLNRLSEWEHYVTNLNADIDKVLEYVSSSGIKDNENIELIIERQIGATARTFERANMFAQRNDLVKNWFMVDRSQGVGKTELHDVLQRFDEEHRSRGGIVPYTYVIYAPMSNIGKAYVVGLDTKIEGLLSNGQNK